VRIVAVGVAALALVPSRGNAKWIATAVSVIEFFASLALIRGFDTQAAGFQFVSAAGRRELFRAGN